jgi:hypothetical protein
VRLVERLLQQEQRLQVRLVEQLLQQGQQLQVQQLVSLLLLQHLVKLFLLLVFE